MKYNIRYIELKTKLIAFFLNPADENLLDISYSVNEHVITIQLVYLDNHTLAVEKKSKLLDYFAEYNVELIIKSLTKEQFNETIDEWKPTYYVWLDNLLFSKGELL